MNRREIFQAAWPALWRIAYRRTRDRVEAEDLTQDAMLAAFESRPEPDDLTSFVSLATSLMRRILYHKRRAAPLREDPTWTAAVAESSLGLRRTPEDIAALRECVEARGFEHARRSAPLGVERRRGRTRGAHLPLVN